MERSLPLLMDETDSAKLRVAVLLPCYKEPATVAKCVRDFRAALPEATVHVFDNNSTDDIAAAGAVVVPSRRQGKGFVVQHMLRTVDADLYVMADGDDTYPASDAPRLIRQPLDSGADMLVGSRLENHEGERCFRPLHVRRFVRTMPLSAGVSASRPT